MEDWAYFSLYDRRQAHLYLPPASSVDAAAMPRLDQVDHKSIILDGVDDPIDTLPYPVLFAATELFAARGARVVT
jgi:hypothetical protein